MGSPYARASAHSVDETFKIKRPASVMALEVANAAINGQGTSESQPQADTNSSYSTRDAGFGFEPTKNDIIRGTGRNQPYPQGTRKEAQMNMRGEGVAGGLRMLAGGLNEGLNGMDEVTVVTKNSNGSTYFWFVRGREAMPWKSRFDHEGNTWTPGGSAIVGSWLDTDSSKVRVAGE